MKKKYIRMMEMTPEDTKRNYQAAYREFDLRLGRCPLGRSNFYGTRRLVFHYLDVALKNLHKKEQIEISMRKRVDAEAVNRA